MDLCRSLPTQTLLHCVLWGCTPDWHQLTGYTWHSNSLHWMAHSEVGVSVLVAGSKALQCVLNCQCCMNPKADLWKLSVGKIVRPGCRFFRQIVTLTNLCSSLSPSGAQLTQILLTQFGVNLQVLQRGNEVSMVYAICPVQIRHLHWQVRMWPVPSIFFLEETLF